MLIGDMTRERPLLNIILPTDVTLVIDRNRSLAIFLLVIFKRRPSAHFSALITGHPCMMLCNIPGHVPLIVHI